jgi:hypothetical protein
LDASFAIALAPTHLPSLDWNSPLSTPQYTVQDIAIHLYTLRSKLAHGVDLRKAAGDRKYPVDLIAAVKFADDFDATPYANLLCEAACYLLCQAIRKLL